MIRKIVRKAMAIMLIIALSFTLLNISHSVNAKSITKVKKITLNMKKAELEVGQKITLKVKKVNPAKASKKVKWTSKNKKIAVVSKKGVVTTKSVGTVKIYATSTKNKKIKAYCLVTVKAKKEVNTSKPVTQTNKGEKGDKGEPGKDGVDGKSAYELYIQAYPEYTGSYTDWLDSLIGEKGEKGDQGEQGIQGDKGDKGDQGEQGIQGDKGDKGDQGEQGIQGEKGDKGDQGEQGIQGEKGDAGENGVDGKSAFELYQEAYPEYTGTYIDWLESLKGEQGEQGRGIEKIELVDGDFIVTYTDGETENLGSSNNKEEALGLTYVLLNDGTYGVRASSSFNESNLVIPEEYNGKKITQILENGFSNHSEITSVTLPSSLEKIGQYAFYLCNNINEITVPTNVYFIGQCAFYRCSSLSNVILENNTGWTAGTDGFSYLYVYYNSSGTYPRTSESVSTYNISIGSSAAEALKGKVKVLVGASYNGSKRTEDYIEKSWYAVDWIR